jgi:hypothetical protein
MYGRRCPLREKRERQFKPLLSAVRGPFWKKSGSK